MPFSLPPLPYNKTDFGTILSAETFDYHYSKHHQTYITNLNNLIVGTEWENKTLNEIVKGSTAKIFNNGAQHWNHSFYWLCMSPKGGAPHGALEQSIIANFGSVNDFLTKFTDSAVNNFGSGWTWLAQKGDKLEIVNTSNAGNPITQGYKPILTVDVWEHAYYIDYRNLRATYLNNFKNIINWDYVNENFNADEVIIKG